MIYFISDCHFGHCNVIGMCNRPFATIDEMNEALITNWNERVRGNDHVYILGDLFFRCQDPESILRRLKGKKHLIIGNHDGSWMERVELPAYFQSVDDFLTMTDGTRGITLCHYPLLTYKHAKKNYMIHGHTHNDTTSDYWPLLRIRERVLNASVEVNGYRPVTFDELVENNSRFKAENE